MDALFVSSPVLFRLESFYIGIACLSVLITIVCIVLYAHYSGAPRGPPFYGDITGLHPQVRVFSIGMTFEAIFCLFFGLIRDHILLYTAHRRRPRPGAAGLLIVSRICLIFAALALLIIAHCPPRSLDPVHTAASAVLCVAALAYFAIGDFLSWDAWGTEAVVSVADTAIGVVAAIVWAIAEWGAAKHWAAAVTGYVIALRFFVKLFLINVEMPKHGIRLTQRLIYNGDRSE
jgi:hypothetical protein